MWYYRNNTFLYRNTMWYYKNNVFLYRNTTQCGILDITPFFIEIQHNVVYSSNTLFIEIQHSVVYSTNTFSL